MIRDIDPLKDFQPAATRKDPLKGFVEMTKKNSNAGNQMLGFAVSLSRSQIRVSTRARKLLDSDYMEILFNFAAKKLAIKPSSKTNANAFKLHGGNSTETQGRQVTVSTHLRAELSKFSNLNLERFRYRFSGELYDDGAAGVLIFDLSDPTDATLLKKRGLE
ncbi:hypothetical protein [Schleiferilactobacillus harbinensis]|uniref:hypothetical protein n=1 Tax=Schleiferilactobacillus harbinensis TaxID=304207 RepID=UPI0039EAE920